MKKIASLLLCLMLLIPCGIKAESGGPSFDGYIAKAGEVCLESMSVSDCIQPLGNGLYLVESPGDAESLPGPVEYVEPNYMIEQLGPPIHGYTPPQWSMSAVAAQAAWEAGLFGEGIKVALIDSGLNTSHEDLTAGNILPVVDFTGDGRPVSDSTGHGSMVGGVMASAVNNSQSAGSPAVDGAASGVTLLPLRIFSAVRQTTVATVISAISYAVEQGCDVINISAGTQGYSVALKEACDAAAASGALLVAAAGNWGGTAYAYPASYDSVVSVAAVTEAEGGYQRAVFSQMNDRVFVTAPGHNITGLGKDSPNDYVTEKEGTSYSAPLVSAMAALAKEQNPGVTLDAFRRLLIATSADLGPPGKDNSFGWGMIDFAAFVDAITREYTVTFANPDNIHGWPSGITYKFSDTEPSALPIPEAEGKIFTGWRSLEGEIIHQIDPLSPRDYILFPQWEAEPGAEVSVLGYTAIYDSLSRTFTVTLPKGSTVTESGIQIIPTGSGKAVQNLGYDPLMGKWSFTVEGSLGTSAGFSMIVITSSAGVPALTGGATIGGTAAPASLDGLAQAKPYIIELPGYFHDEIPLTYTVRRKDGEVVLPPDTQGRFTYTPSPGDFGEVIFYATADNGAFSSPTLTITVSISPPPSSQPRLGMQGAVLDINAPADILVPLTLYDSSLGEVWLFGEGIGLIFDEGTHYSVRHSVTDGWDAAVLSGSALAGILPSGQYNVRFGFTAGEAQMLTLTVTDSTHRYTVTFKGMEGEAYHRQSGIRAGDKIALPAKPEREGYIFDGWYTGKGGNGVPFTAETPVNADLTLYAKWTAIADPVPSPGPGPAGGGGDAPSGGSGGKGAAAPTIESLEKQEEPPYRMSFLDMDENAWYYEPVREMCRRGLLTGVDEHHFAPQMNISRAMLVTILWRMEGSPKGQQSIFGDVADDAWYAQAVAWAADCGAITGYGNGCFGPNDAVTRQQMAVILYRLAVKSNQAAASGHRDARYFDDWDSVSLWAREAACWAADSGLIIGDQQGLISPQSTATRAEAAVIMMRFLEWASEGR